jgi:hypothetical protein
MRNALAYRRYAKECLELASTMNDPQARAILMKMAQVWSRLADERSPVRIHDEGQIGERGR